MLLFSFLNMAASICQHLLDNHEKCAACPSELFNWNDSTTPAYFHIVRKSIRCVGQRFERLNKKSKENEIQSIRQHRIESIGIVFGGNDIRGSGHVDCHWNTATRSGE